jgi:hypothetical protein
MSDKDFWSSVFWAFVICFGIGACTVGLHKQRISDHDHEFKMKKLEKGCP